MTRRSEDQRGDVRRDSVARRRQPSRSLSKETSTTIPQPLRTFIARHRLDAVLDEAVTRPVTSLIAPAGAGKTASLARWATRPDAPPVHWLSAPLAEPVAVLADALSAAAHQPLDTFHGPGDAADHARDLYFRMAGGAEPPDVLVIDDAHLLPAAAWAFLEDVISRVPDHVRLLLASRRDLPLATVALGLSDAITVLRGDMLRFDDAEAGQLITAHAPDATGEDIRTLQHRAQGWAAALVLGARALSAAADRPAARAELAHTELPILDYLLGEVFLTLAASTRHLLLCVCDEDTITEASAVLLSGDPRAAAHLVTLATDGMLVTSYRHGEAASQEPAWRLHPLLRELLRRQTASDGPDRALALAAHHRAAQHYALQGPVADAVLHAAAAGDHQLLIELIVEEGPGLLAGGHDEELAAGLRALPDSVIATHPALLGLMALERSGVGDVEIANRLAEQSIRAAAKVRHRLAPATDDMSTQLPTAADLALVADAAILNAYRARFGWANSWDAIRAAREILGCADAHGTAAARPAGASPALAVSHRLHHRWPLAPARMAWLLHELAGAETWAGELDAAQLHVGETLVTAQALGLNRLSAAALANRALLEVIDARFQSAATSASECMAAAARAGPMQDSSLARAYLAQAWAAYYDVRFDKAHLALSRVGCNEGPMADPLVATMSVLLRARLDAVSGEVDAARRLIAGTLTVPEPVPPFLASQVAVGRADLALLSGDLQEARRQAEVMRETVADTDDTLLHGLLADLEGDTPGAVEHVERAMRAPAIGYQAVIAAVGATYRTRIHLREGDPKAAEVTLRDALTRVAPQRILYPMVRVAASDPAFQVLLEHVTHGPAPHTFAGQALAALHRYRHACDDSAMAAKAHPRVPGPRSPIARSGKGNNAAGETGSPGATAPAPLTVPLTDREADVLRELALGGSYQDIAQTLFVTENTVKTHLASLYRKLGADRRASALRHARELGLV
jgi:LuxR family maltose regulon positive regulatory protein